LLNFKNRKKESKVEIKNKLRVCIIAKLRETFLIFGSEASPTILHFAFCILHFHERVDLFE